MISGFRFPHTTDTLTQTHTHTHTDTEKDAKDTWPGGEVVGSWAKVEVKVQVKWRGGALVSVFCFISLSMRALLLFLFPSIFSMFPFFQHSGHNYLYTIQGKNGYGIM